MIWRLEIILSLLRLSAQIYRGVGRVKHFDPTLRCHHISFHVQFERTVPNGIGADGRMFWGKCRPERRRVPKL